MSSTSVCGTTWASMRSLTLAGSRKAWTMSRWCHCRGSSSWCRKKVPGTISVLAHGGRDGCCRICDHPLTVNLLARVSCRVCRAILHRGRICLDGAILARRGPWGRRKTMAESPRDGVAENRHEFGAAGEASVDAQRPCRPPRRPTAARTDRRGALRVAVTRHDPSGDLETAAPAATTRSADAAHPCRMTPSMPKERPSWP